MDTKGNPSLINLFLVVRYTAPDNKNRLLTLCMLVFIVNTIVRLRNFAFLAVYLDIYLSTKMYFYKVINKIRLRYSIHRHLR